MKICIISDTHSKHRSLSIPEDIDTIICAGDITYRGELSILEDFANWMKELPIKNKLVIFGNHELKCSSEPKRSIAVKLIQDAGIHYLENNSLTIDGINFWGSPVTPWFHSWEWNYQRGPEIAAFWSKIPEDTHVIISHGPPMGIFDLVDGAYGESEHVGCQDLKERIEQLKHLKLVCFGHIHEGYGKFTRNDDCIFVNAAMCDEDYNITRKPVVVEI